jgi:hypothetical protein
LDAFKCMTQDVRRCESAVRAMTSEGLLPSACHSPSALRCHNSHPIYGLGGYGILETVTHHSTNSSGCCVTSLAENNVIPLADEKTDRKQSDREGTIGIKKVAMW